MPRRPLRRFAVAFLALWWAVPFVVPRSAHAGQLRIDVTSTPGSGFFSPASPSVNLGDHVVWLWRDSGFHSVTSGSAATCTPSPLFDSGEGSGQRFSWKSSQQGAIPYFCIPHCPGTMNGTLSVLPPGSVNVSDFRITEVFDDISGPIQDFIEITNLGNAAGNLGRYRLSVRAGASFELPLLDIAVPSGGRVVVHLGEAGTNTQTDIYITSLGDTLTRDGSAALYVPRTGLVLTDLTRIIDFVQWGAAGQANETTANDAGFWATGTFIPAVALGRSYEFCGTPADHGEGFWEGIVTPNPHASNCVDEIAHTTWGRVKVIYR